MKKTLAAVAILGAFAGSAMADVTIYGRVDTGLGFAQNKVYATQSGDVLKDTKAEATGMHNGMNTGSRLGFKGSEKVGDNTFGFVLEGAVSGDTGATDGFKRAATVYAQGAFGKLEAGRMGTVWSDAYAGKYVAVASVDGSGHSGLGIKGAGLFQISASRYDNMIAYTAPKFAGVELFAQYGAGSNDVEFESGSDRYMAVGATYEGNGLKMAAMVEQINEKSTAGEVEDAVAFHVGGQYDFGVAKASVAAVYFKDANDVAGTLALANTAAGYTGDDAAKAWKLDDGEGYGVNLGVAVPVCGGTLTATAAYLKGEATVGTENVDVMAYNVGAVYDYYLSKQVKLYVGGGYSYNEFEADILKAEFKEAKVGAGMVYYF